jgi:hypothetical protein
MPVDKDGVTVRDWWRQFGVAVAVAVVFRMVIGEIGHPQWVSAAAEALGRLQMTLHAEMAEGESGWA